MKTSTEIINGGSSFKLDSWLTITNYTDDAKASELLIYGQIGKGFFDDDGISDKAFAEAFDAIPSGKEITVAINSVGGNVDVGLAIYNRLNSRKNKVTCRIDGIAASIASVIALGGKSLQIPANGAMMMHDPEGMCMGSSEEMRKHAGRLDMYRDRIASVYAGKTGKPIEHYRAKMREETWLVGKEAVDEGLADTLLEPTPTIQNNLDLSAFRRVPTALQNTTNSAVAGGAPQNAMSKPNIIGAPADARTDAEPTNQLPASPPAAATPTPATVPTVINDAGGASQNLLDITNRLQATEKQLEAARKQNVTRIVDELISNAQLPGAQRDVVIVRAMADETILDVFRAMPSRPPGGVPLVSDVSIIAENGADLGKQFMALNKSDAGSDRGSFYVQHRDRIRHVVVNTNTVSSDLKRAVLLQEGIMAFAPMLAPLSAFSTLYTNIPLQGTDEVAVPYFALDTTTSSDFNGTYSTGNTAVSSKKVTIDKRKYQGLSFTSSELRRQPFLSLEKVLGLKIQKLGEDVFADVLSVVTIDPYAQAITAVAANAFTSDSVVALRTKCNTLHWPKMGRSLMLDSEYDGALLQDSSIKSAMNYGGAEGIREGQIPKLFGFSYFETPSIPDNSENLKGMAVFSSAILVGTSPIQPAPAVMQQLSAYEVYVEPKTGAALEYRAWGTPGTDTESQVIEFNYGYVAGEVKALVRIPAA